ncbi:MAG: SH3 domain-containing protein [Halobacteriovoraceae bacterium]|nr:SH3 domain-containing protein [Halobacteriovoraceae bacterium]
MKLKLTCFLILLASSFQSFALKKIELGTFYFNGVYGNIKENPDTYASIVTSFSCGHPVVMQGFQMNSGQVQKKFSANWVKVKTGPYEGFLQEKYLSDKKPECLQDKYPNFFRNFDFSITETFYWAQLNDLFIEGASKDK